MRGRFLEALAVLVAGGLLLYSGISSKGMDGAFKIAKLKVEGGSSGILRDFIGKDLRKIKREDVARLLSRDPFVASVEVEKIYPHTLLVRIRRKRPFACMLRKEGEMLVDAEGNIIKRGCPHDVLRFVPSDLPMDFQLRFIRTHLRELKVFQWIEISSPFYLEGKLRGVAGRVRIGFRHFSEKLSLLLSALPALKGKFSLLDFTCEGKLYLRREK